MIAILEGEILQKNPDSMIVMVGKFGFEIFCDPLLASQFPPVGDKAKIWTYMNVRENEISLYGFPNEEIKKLFELLITVSGIGPKVAGGIVGNINPESFALAVINDDLKVLTSLKGIGNKTAQRLILELKDKVKKSLPSLGKRQATAELSAEMYSDQHILELRNEAVVGLMVLGYKEDEANAAVNKSYQIMKEKEEEIVLENLLKTALKQLSVL